jgi:PIN domain
MAGHARYTALLDACVLYPLAIADSLISLAAAGLYAAKWTTAIEEEWIRNLQIQRSDLVGKLAYRRDQMRLAVGDWEVPEAAWTAITGHLRLPDEGDAHVLAAAIAGHVDCIVTANLKDFPSDILTTFGLTAIHPDDFIVAQLDLEQLAALVAFKEMRARRKRPQESPEEFARTLERNGLPATAARLKEAAALI